MEAKNVMQGKYVCLNIEPQAIVLYKQKTMKGKAIEKLQGVIYLITCLKIVGKLFLVQTGIINK